MKNTTFELWVLGYDHEDRATSFCRFLGEYTTMRDAVAEAKKLPTMEAVVGADRAALMRSRKEHLTINVEELAETDEEVPEYVGCVWSTELY